MERAIDEVKRRSLLDPAFRALALSDPMGALAKVNPRPLPVGSVRFVESADAVQESNEAQVIVAALPPAGEAVEELSDSELEDVAGGGGPPVGMS